MPLVGIALLLGSAHGADLSRLERPGLYRGGRAVSITGLALGLAGNALFLGGSVSQGHDAAYALVGGGLAMMVGYPMAGAGATMSAMAVRDARYDHPMWPGLVGFGSWPFAVAQMRLNRRAVEGMSRTRDEEWLRQEREYLDTLDDELDALDDAPQGFLRDGMPRLDPGLERRPA